MVFSPEVFGFIFQGNKTFLELTVHLVKLVNTVFDCVSLIVFRYDCSVSGVWYDQQTSDLLYNLVKMCKCFAFWTWRINSQKHMYANTAYCDVHIYVYVD